MRGQRYERAAATASLWRMSFAFETEVKRVGPTMNLKISHVLPLAGVLLAACDPSIPNTPPTAVVVARFDPAASIIPTPNDLLTNPATGNTQVPIAASASGADKAFLGYLNQLNGFPASSGGVTTFDAPIDEASVTDQSVRVFDVTDGFKPVTVNRVVSEFESAITPAPTDGGATTATFGRLGIAAPTGWIAGHTYAIAIVGGSGGVKAKDGRPVVGSATWAFLRNEKSLVTCADPAGPLTKDNCVAATNIIPSAQKEDPAARLADQTASALRLEPLRLKYASAIGSVVSAGVARGDIALLWTFKVAQKVAIAFDPTMSVIPLPNDLLKNPATGLLNVPVQPTDSPAAAEFTTDYLNTLDGFPVSAGASANAQGGGLDPATVNADTVKVVVLSGAELAAPPVIGCRKATPTAADCSAITISPAAGSWGKARTLGVAIVGGAKGVKAADGSTVVASQVWAIVRSGASLVDCADLASPDCKALLTAAPVSLAQVKALEGLRRGYADALDALEADVPRADVALFWTFSTVSFPEATFDPSGSIIPFPNDILRSPTTGRLNLPIPAGAPALLANLLGGLNTLDGFSTTAAAVSENSDTRGAIDLGAIDPATLDAGTGFIKASNLATGLQPRVTRCLNCASTLQADGGVQTLQQLQFVPQAPLDEQTTYAAYVTTDLKDTAGKPVVAAPTFALLRLKNPLIDGTGKATLSTITDAQAAQLEPLRLAGKASLDGLEAGLSLPRKKVSLAWAYKTQSTISTLQGLHDVIAAPTTAGGGLSTVPTAVAPVPTASLPAALPKAALAASFFVGNIVLPVAINTPLGVLNPNPATWRAQKAPFILFVPTGTPPAAGWPVAIFGHGLSGDRQQASAIANAFAARGYATIAIDVINHGERNSCVGVGAVISMGLPGATDDFACAMPGPGNVPDPTNNRCEPTTGRCERRATAEAAAPAVVDCTVGGDLACLAAGQGFCRANNKCEGAVFLRSGATATAPLFNSWNFLNLTNLFATRDNFRHAPMDFNQLVRVLQSTAAGNLSSVVGAALTYGGPALDGSTISYSGLSLGSFNGTMFSAVNPVVRNFALSVPGADQSDVLLTAPAFATQRAGFLGSLAALGVVPGTSAFDNFIVLTRTIFDPSDPQNAIFAGVNRAAPATRKMYLQYIIGDPVLPNTGTFRLISAAQRGTVQALVRELNPSFTDLPVNSRHGVALNFANPALTVAAQTQLSNFVATGAE